MADITAPPVRPPRTPVTVGDITRPPATTVEPNDHVAAAAYLMEHAGATALVIVDPRTGRHHHRDGHHPRRRGRQEPQRCPDPRPDDRPPGRHRQDDNHP
jgi:CBS domain-containing protein